MKLNELIDDFEIYTTNEEKQELTQLEGMVPFATLSERQQVIINNLIRKSLVSKVRSNNGIMVVKNEL
tara:strand:+ start:260 stop:463 length:204 start_codon:yes stop_codon:yes gene_type:complete